MREKLKNKEMEEKNYSDGLKIEKLEKKLSVFQETQEKLRILEKTNQSFNKKMEFLIEEKQLLENKYKNYTQEIEKVGL